MAKYIETSIIINATAKQVWNTLINFDSFPEWNPFILKATGTLKVGNQINIDLGKMKFKPIIKELEQNKKLSWLGHLFFKGIFDGKHSFELQEISSTQTKLIHSEKFNGLLVPIMGKSIFEETKSGFEAMNKALKTRCETSSSD